MYSFPDPKTKDPKAHRVQRILEVIPGTLTWLTIVGMFALSFLVPVWVAYFIIAFDIYWILRTIFIAYYSVQGFRKLQEGKKIDWWERCQEIKEPRKYGDALHKRYEKFKQAIATGEITDRKQIKILKHEARRQKKYIKEVNKLEAIKDEI
ncbi:MAG TPA: hypothetical protein VK255_00725, partial [Patescibacteria group bacterium]|nr:hypothetical protein [Patescibacteria group bacterium]